MTDYVHTRFTLNRRRTMYIGNGHRQSQSTYSTNDDASDDDKMNPIRIISYLATIVAWPLEETHTRNK